MNSPASPDILEVSINLLQRGDQPVLRAIKWRVRPGEHWALLGANGSGKTTLLRAVCGYEWPTDGTLRVLGRLFGATDLRELRKAIGLVSASLAQGMWDELTGLEIALSGFDASIGLWREFDEFERAIAGFALASMGASAIEQRPWRVLSQGERQRAMIARALAHPPALLILDEPCGGLDPFAREKFLRDLTLFAAARNGPAMVFVTHHIEEIPPFVTHGLVLREGRVLAQGPIADVCSSETLGAAFRCKCDVAREDGRFAIRIIA